jgi:multimeric flavodoxin WrbA/nitrite reductase/ring-hydroxylating ferredoxin subunit
MAHWHDLGPISGFAQPLTPVVVGRTKLAVTNVGGHLGVISGVCNHAGGPLAQGRIDGDYVVCPWHNWKYHARTGLGEPGYEEDACPAYAVQVDDGRLLVDLESPSKRTRKKHERHPLARPVVRAPGTVRVAGISTTNMDVGNPRYSTSDALLDVAMEFAAKELGAETQTIRLAELSFRSCEGYYSKSARACTWPCSITQMDPADQLDRVYEALVHWADAIIIATPIRWGNASGLYYKMIERLNCVQNQLTIADRTLIRNKVAGFIITGGQDNVQAVAGQVLGFFAELGFTFPQFPYIAHSRGWSAEDMENNIRYVQMSEELRDGARQLAARSVDMAHLLLDHEEARHTVARGGRKAHRLSLGLDGEETSAEPGAAVPDAISPA